MQRCFVVAFLWLRESDLVMPSNHRLLAYLWKPDIDEQFFQILVTDNRSVVLLLVRAEQSW